MDFIFIIPPFMLKILQNLATHPCMIKNIHSGLGEVPQRFFLKLSQRDHFTLLLFYRNKNTWKLPQFCAECVLMQEIIALHTHFRPHTLNIDYYYKPYVQGGQPCKN
jgi:hypothetical protein